MPIFLECVLEDCACGVVGCDSKEWVLAMGGWEEEGVAVLGEGADEGILQEVVWVASVKEVGFEEDGVAKEVGGVCADSAYAQELAVRETLTSVEGMAGRESETIMGICGFGVEVNPQCAVRFKVNHGVKEGKMGGGYFEGEFDGGMAGVEVVDKGKEGHKAMLPNKEDVVYEPFP